MTDPAAEIAEIYVIREALETCAARLAATRITEKQLARLDELVRAGKRASYEERVRINQQFHLAIAEASGSARLLAMIRGLREYFLHPRWVSQHDRAMAKRALEDHREIVAALRARSTDRVERLLRRYLKLGWDNQSSSLGANGSFRAGQ